MLVARTQASALARERLTVMLLTLSRQWTVEEGCRRLGMKRTRFQDLRRRVLQAGAEALEGGVRGRPRNVQRQVDESGLDREVSQLRRRLRVARTQVDIFDCGLGDQPRVRAALHAAHVSGGSV